MGDDDAPESIGMAVMEDDGTIVLSLRAAGPGSIIGDGQFRYSPADRDYPMVMRHLGGLRPGQEKPVRPFPD